MVTTGGSVPNRVASAAGASVAVGSAQPVEGAGRLRTGRLRSIRLRLLLPIVVATAGLVVLGVVQTQFAVGTAIDARRAQVMAATATATVRLAHQLEQEIAESDALRARGGTTGSALVDAADGQTDRLTGQFRTEASTARTVAPALRAVLDMAESELNSLATVRDSVRALKPGQSVGDKYADLTASLIAVADALPTQLTDAELAGTARAVGAIAAAEHLGALQRDLLSQVFRRGSLAPGELAELARLAGAQDERLAEFTRSATLAQLNRYNKLVGGDDVVAALKIRTAVLAARPDPGSVRVDPDAWYIVQSNGLRQLHQLQLELSDTLDASSRSRQVRAQISSVLTGTATGLLVLLAFSAALLFGVRTSRRLRTLRGAALTIANTELPGAIMALSTASEPAAVRSALKESVAQADKLTVRGLDEIGEVGAALGAVHRQALRLAADQALLRLDVAGLFVALSRRGQTFIHRQLQLIDEFERNETDPNRLDRLFALDHLAARMRRNEENLLVLAGGEPGRRVTASVALTEVIRAAGAETEDYARVDPGEVTEVGIAAHAARDLIHLLAELLENATGFSPPSRRVRVAARRAVDRVVVTVFDEGIGIPEAQVAELNVRLRRPTTLTAELAGTMGLLVIARLAARHGIVVELRSSPGGGTAALVSLPNGVLAPVPARDQPTARVVMATHPPATPSGAAAEVAALGGAAGSREGMGGAAGSREGMGGAAGSRGGKAEPTAAPAPAVTAAATAEPAPGPNGLPQRRPGDLLVSGHAVDAGDFATSTDPNQPLDPDVVRARLSGLASGLAAAARRNQSST